MDREFKDGGVLAVLENIVKGAPEAMVQGVTNLRTSAGDVVFLGEKVAMGSRISELVSGLNLGELFGGKAKEVAAVEAPTQQISAPVKQLGKYDVDIADLGSFAAPTIGSSNRGGMGITA